MWGEPPIEVISALSPWPKKETPRYAGLSAFGFSGSNAHIIVAEAPAVVSPAQSSARDQAVEQADAPYALYLSARSAFSLRALAERYASAVASTPEQDLHTLCLS
jgi:acyl transferase domain-containing protein